MSSGDSSVICFNCHAHVCTLASVRLVHIDAKDLSVLLPPHTEPVSRDGLALGTRSGRVRCGVSAFAKDALTPLHEFAPRVKTYLKEKGGNEKPRLRTRSAAQPRNIMFL